MRCRCYPWDLGGVSGTLMCLWDVGGVCEAQVLLWDVGDACEMQMLSGVWVSVMLVISVGCRCHFPLCRGDILLTLEPTPALDLNAAVQSRCQTVLLGKQTC